MKLVFAHDHRIYKYRNCYYSNGGLSEGVLKKYTDIFGKLTVLCRMITIDKMNKNLSKIDNTDINFVNCEWSSSSYKKELRNADVLISRLPSVNGMKTISFAKKNNIPYLVELVGCPWDALWNHSVKGKIVAPFVTILTKYQVKKGASIILCKWFFPTVDCF